MTVSTILIVANIVFYGYALYLSARRVQRSNRRVWLRFAACVIAGYIFIVYVLSLAGIIPEIEIRLYMRWFQLVIAVYIIAEAQNG